MITNTTLTQYLHQWGATAVPFCSKRHSSLFTTEHINKAIGLLNQCAALRSVMLLHGANGVGKSHLASYWIHQLNPKEYLSLTITQASINSSGVVALLLEQLGHPLRLRQGQNLNQFSKAIKELDPILPVLVLDEAQQYNPSTLEEIRLLLGLNLPTQPTFALIMIGEDYLLKTLTLQSQRALQSRVALKYQLPLLNRNQTLLYLQYQLKEVGILQDCFAEAAVDLIFAASQGTQRIINHISSQAWIMASEKKQTTITAQEVQDAIEMIPGAQPQKTSTH